MRENQDISEHIASIRETARSLEGRQVILRTRRGEAPQGELWGVGHASCSVGFTGKWAYGGVVSIEETAR